MKYLILGANGLIGKEFVKLCEEKGVEYVGTRYSRAKGDYREVNFQEPGALAAVLDEVSPAVVVNCVNLAGGVNFCEENHGLARTLHVDSVKVIVNWCARNDAEFVFFSTDYVFDGKNPPYKENDKTGPLNLYGKLKLESENYIREKMERYLIVRTTNMYGWDPETVTPNFLMYLYQTLEEGKSFNAPSFLFGNPTYAPDLVKAVMDLLRKQIFGLFHIVGNGYIDRYDWALKFCDRLGLDREKINEISSPPSHMVPRPLKSNLDAKKFRNVSDVNLSNVDEGLDMFYEAWKANQQTNRAQR